MGWDGIMSRSRRWSGSWAGDSPIFWMGVFLYWRMALAARSLSNNPWAPVLPLIILLADLTATSAQLSTYCRQKGMPQADKEDTRTNAYPNYEAKPNRQTCGGCGSHLDGTSGTGSHQLKCPAWGQTCSNCGKPNHQLRVCRAKEGPGN